MSDKLLKIGIFLFKYRGIIPLPFIILIIILGAGTINIKSKILIKYIGIFTSLSGELIRLYVAGYAKRETSDRSKKLKAGFIMTHGLYSIIRNPIYIGNYLIFLGFLIFSGNILVLALGSILFFIYYYLIILAEENFLKQKFDNEYEGFLKSTPRFIPKSLKIKTPPFNFEFKKAIFKEKDTIFIWVVLFIILDERLCGFCPLSIYKIIIFFSISLFWIITNLLKTRL